MSEKTFISAEHEGSMDRASDGVPHSSSIGNTGGDYSKERSPWDKFLARLRSVRLVKSATKLRGLRNEANAWFPTIEGERQAAEAELETVTDPLDKAALKEDLEAIGSKLTKLNDGLAAINERAEALVGDSGA